MRTSRIVASSVFASAATFAIIASCGPDTGGRHSTVDAPALGHPDASGSNPSIDAPPTGDDPLGRSCTAGATGMEQSDCPTGFICLNLTGGTHAWCSKSCTQAADTCATGYTGPGLAKCYLGVGSGVTMPNFCGVICEDDTGNNGVCPAGVCTGACPSTPTLACTAELKSGATVVGKGCQ